MYLNSGDGTLQPSVSYDVGNGSDAIAVADWNGDGKPDLVVADEGQLSILLNTSKR